MTLWRVLLSYLPLVALLLGLCGASRAEQADDPSVQTQAAPVTLVLANRPVVTLRANLLGESPQTRVQRAEYLLKGLLRSDNPLEVNLQPIQNSILLLVGGQRAFIVSPGDLGPEAQTVQQAAEQAAAALRQVIREAHEGRSLQFLLQAAGWSLLATLLLYLALRLLLYVRQKLMAALLPLMRQQTSRFKIGNTSVLDTGLLYPLLRRSVGLLCGGLILLCLFEWLSFVLQRFPFTRPWGEGLDAYLFDLAAGIASAMLSALPDLLVALVIFLLAKGSIALLAALLQRLAAPGTISWLTRETLLPTSRLLSLAIWLFALAMAYPYLPGAQTEAFKGLSVIVGLMISLGASNVVGQAAAGLILTYSHTLRVGEFVRVGEHEGTVIALGMFTTRIQTGAGEILTLPNTLITGSVTKNFSRVVEGPGYLLDTSVTIGYDTPWRQVEAMLLEAARLTPGIQTEPAPRVLQTALSDFYPEYRLVAHAVPEVPTPRADLLSRLHANIQDVFNRYGVAIMSPHYMADTAQSKHVPPEHWYPAPARAPDPQVDPARDAAPPPVGTA
ncbi:mechanosensitive ion channel family protein [Pseudaeromonas paramecii]|uniref:Small-conductance mechanosensitive channel n=1 Tax=Pseudaeromonas paramecii TaxID=2138166 RepID=A0ABP8QD60_9GAMM